MDGCVESRNFWRWPAGPYWRPTKRTLDVDGVAVPYQDGVWPDLTYYNLTRADLSSSSRLWH